MCVFIKVTSAESKSVSYMNMDEVKEMYEGEHGTQLFFNDDDFITVEETAGQIMHKIKQMQEARAI